MKKIIIIVSVLCLLGIGYGIITVATRAGKEPVKILVLPQDAVVAIEGEAAKNGQTIYLEPGEYLVTAERSGFSDYSEVYSVIEAQDNIIDFALTPNSEEGSNYIRDNQSLYLEFEDRSGTRAREEGEEFADKNPIILDLPYESFFFTIGYRIDPDNIEDEEIIIEIDAKEGYKNAALQQLRNFGYNPTEYNINFRDHRNPFDE